MKMGQDVSTPPRDKVVLYQIPRGRNIPSISPYCLKLETYLRMANIEYENDVSYKASPKGQFPWIQYNDEKVADSQFCIEYLNEKFHVDLNRNLTNEEKAIARSFLKMTEENFLWAFGLYRFIYNKDYLMNTLMADVSWMIKAYIRSGLCDRMVNKRAWSQGMSRHSKEEMMHIMELDLRAMSDYLGDKAFFLGSEPTEVDASLFGVLAQMTWATDTTAAHRLYMKDSCPNLIPYCERMRDRYWRDWNEIITSKS